MPSTQTDNPVLALPLYLLGILVQFGAILFIYIAGGLIGLTGLVILIVGLVRWLCARAQAVPPPIEPDKS
ncbi:MAG: hypothetical protein ACOYNN_14410 [Terrimicrobiaceae bacterium]